jgi:SAM-dependent methyltransferase
VKQHHVEAGAKQAGSQSLLCSLAARWYAFHARRRVPESFRLSWAVEDLYARVATDPGGEFDFHRGAEYAAKHLGYDAAELAALPASSTSSFAGVGNPHLIEPLRVGELVLDVGSGAGTDLLVAARRIGPSGRAVGIDMTAEMIERCRASITESGLDNVEVRRGTAQALPLEEASVDVVISNGVLNLVQDKERAFGEIARVLRRGGRLMLADVVLTKTLWTKVVRNADLWASRVSGALTEAKLIELVTGSGLSQACVTQRFDCVTGTRKESFARMVGLRSVNLYAVKP